MKYNVYDFLLEKRIKEAQKLLDEGKLKNLEGYIKYVYGHETLQKCIEQKPDAFK